ncbi:hypothetical protein GT347_17605 [Xylophilus rhododendri]|uniref:Uncharacterized protein n=1 Tax=Xylophilus rhododendri TaxID=2697032 RepID=A0A857J954_9BURK|nr:hypothetical protein [Xylophilus rhododendri]QHI99631.1 hypothetical protein GT347_17605 [Xylophilus rhododendri]
MSFLSPSLAYSLHNNSLAFPANASAPQVDANPYTPGHPMLRSILENHPRLGALLLDPADWSAFGKDETEDEPTRANRPRAPRKRRNLHRPAAPQPAAMLAWQVLEDGATLGQALDRYLTRLSERQDAEAAELLGQVSDYTRFGFSTDARQYILQRFDVARQFVTDLDDAAAVHRTQPGIDAALGEAFDSASAVIRHGNMPRDAHVLLVEALRRQAQTTSTPLESTSTSTSTGTSSTGTTTESVLSRRLALIENFYRGLPTRGTAGLTLTEAGFHYGGKLHDVPLDTALQVLPEGRIWCFLFFEGYVPPLGSTIHVTLPGERSSHELQMRAGRYRLVDRLDWRPNPYFINDPMLRYAQLSALQNALDQGKAPPYRS